jgi:[ribosomal protein S5]-alanine N-acetyltransferase
MDFRAMRLTTGRLELRPLRPDDADSLFAIYADPEFARYWSAPPWTDRAQAREYLAKGEQDLATGQYLRLGIFLRDAGELVGTCSLFNFVPSCRRADLGYGIARPHWRRGYMGEAVGALLHHAFDVLALHRLEADVDPRNEASIRALEKLGFQREGYLRERWIVGDEISDTAFYGLLAREWRAKLDG